MKRKAKPVKAWAFVRRENNRIALMWISPTRQWLSKKCGPEVNSAYRIARVEIREVAK